MARVLGKRLGMSGVGPGVDKDSRACYAPTMNENKVWKFVGIVAGGSFLAGMGSMVALSNMMGWF